VGNRVKEEKEEVKDGKEVKEVKERSWSQRFGLD